MKGVIVYQTVKTLSDNGLSQRVIVSQLKMSKTTVNEYLKLGNEEALVKLISVKKESQFDVAIEFILEKLYYFPDIRASKLYRLVTDKYPEITAKQRAFRKYIQRLRKKAASRQQRFYQPVINDLPGHQMQVDPGQFQVERDEETKFTVYFIAFVLSHSRKIFVHFQTTPYNTNDFINAHLQAFQYYGGLAFEYVYKISYLIDFQIYQNRHIRVYDCKLIALCNIHYMYIIYS